MESLKLSILIVVGGFFLYIIIGTIIYRLISYDDDKIIFIIWYFLISLGITSVVFFIIFIIDIVWTGGNIFID